ncbi:MAG: chemotaxis protein, partial [Lachnospiraceae bacterium]
FAVVASEISKLSEQTSSATVDITEIINNISAELANVSNVISDLVAINKLQSEKVSRTAENFEGIEKVSLDLGKQARMLSGAVKDLATANSGIVDSIQTISAITEEVTAHSGETYNSSEDNEKTAIDVTGLMEEINNLAQQLTQE